MTELEADAVLDEYVARHPAAGMALADDPLFLARMELLRRTLALLEPALYQEGLDRRAVLRVVNTIVYGVPDPDAALLRMADTRARIETAKLAAPNFIVGPELAEDLSAEGERA